MKKEISKEKKRGKGKLLVKFLYGSKRFFIVSIVASIIVAVTDTVNPQIIRYAVDTVLGDKKSGLPKYANDLISGIGGVGFLRENLWTLAVAVMIVATAAAIFRYIQRMSNAKASQTLVERMRNLLFDHIQTLPFSWHMKNQTGDVIQRCTSDVETVKNFLSEQLIGIMQIVLQVGLSLTMMYSMNIKLAVVSTLTLPVILVYSALLGKKIGQKFKECDEAESALSAATQENLTGVRVVRSFGREKHETDKFAKLNKNYLTKWLGLSRLSAMFWGLGDLFAGMQVMLIVILGVIFCVNDGMTSGELIAFVSYNAMLSWPIRRLGRMISEMSKAGISMERLSYILDSESESDREGAGEPDLHGDIVFDNVSFAYDNCPELLHNISFTAKAGSTVGILGGTGSGKSTLMHLLGRLYDLPDDGSGGRITINGTDIKDIKAKHIRKNVGTVLQEPYLFSRTLAENIAITKDAVNMDEVRRAAAIASLDETVMSFSDGYDTFVGEKGVTLSGGQKQRAAIARMLTQNAPIMIFDDSLSAVDAETDAKIRNALSTNLGDSTVFLISHRTATLMNSDLIIVLEHGRIAEMGDHNTLMQKEDGIYKKIYTIQMSDPDEAEEVTA